MDAAGIFAWMTARAIPGVETTTETSFARHLRMPGGPAWFEVRQDSGGKLRLRARVTHLGDLAPLVATARRTFDLDADPVAIDAALSAHPELSPLVARVPGIRVPGAADPHEMLIRAMVGQQISVVAARTALIALTEALGEETEDGGRLFPTMSAIAERGAEVLRGPAARIRAVTGAAAALAELPTDRPVLLVCAAGARSARVADVAHAAGVDARSVEGGAPALLLAAG